MEAAGARRIHGRRDLPFQQDRPSRRFEVWIGYRDRALEYFGVRMYRFVANRVARPDLHDLAEVHDRDAIAHVPHHGQVVRDEEKREVELLLQVLQQIDDLRLDRDVQAGDRFVWYAEGRGEDQGARDADRLTP